MVLSEVVEKLIEEYKTAETQEYINYGAPQEEMYMQHH